MLGELIEILSNCSDPGAVRTGGNADRSGRPGRQSASRGVEALLSYKWHEYGERSVSSRRGPRRRCSDALSVVLRSRHGHGRRAARRASLAAEQSGELRASELHPAGLEGRYRTTGARVGRVLARLADIIRRFQDHHGIFLVRRTRHMDIRRLHTKVFLQLLQVSIERLE